MGVTWRSCVRGIVRSWRTGYERMHLHLTNLVLNTNNSTKPVRTHKNKEIRGEGMSGLNDW